MHGLVTIHKLNQQNAEAERIMKKHEAADQRQAELFGAHQEPTEEKVAISDPQ